MTTQLPVNQIHVRFPNPPSVGILIDKDPAPNKPIMFDFLGLPREIRDMVYGFLFLREEIQFEEFYTDETPEDWMKDRRPESLTLHTAKPNEIPLLKYNGIPFVHRVESLVPIDGRSRWDDEFLEHKTRSYRIFRGTIEPPCVRVFHTNRFVYQESSPVFYAKNCFKFPAKDCELTLNACSAFLTDRPKQALSCIKHVSLGIGHISRYGPCNPSVRYGVHLPTLKRLCNTLGCTVQLDRLNLLFEEQCPMSGRAKMLVNSQDYVGFFEWLIALNSSSMIVMGQVLGQVSRKYS